MATRIDNGGPAFPRPASIDPTNGTLPDGDRVVDEQDGMTLRDYFAAKFMAVFISTARLMQPIATKRGKPPKVVTYGGKDWEVLAADAAYQSADAMLAARKAVR